MNSSLIVFPLQRLSSDIVTTCMGWLIVEIKYVIYMLDKMLYKPRLYHYEGNRWSLPFLY
jgi:hypothetical protein